MSGYDFIGDIHGEATKLKGLLDRLGYELRNGVYQHPERTAVFVGDYIDRGNAMEEVYRIVRGMVEAGSALATMGNHEFNAVCYATWRHDHVDYLRPHLDPWGPKNYNQHKEFLAQVPFDSPLHQEIIAWFKTLPLWIETPDFRAVHACWYQPAIDTLRDAGYVDGHVDEEFFHRASDEEDVVFQAMEDILKSPDFDIDPLRFRDKDGNVRRRARLRWWLSGATTIRELADLPDGTTQPDGSPLILPDRPLLLDRDFTYPVTERPVFFGHYWRTGDPVVSGARAICVDYSAVKSGHSLVAYRFDGLPLSAEHFVQFSA